MRDTIDMAREAGFTSDEFAWHDHMFERFEALVRADEREQYKWDIHSCGPTCKRYACVAMREAVEVEREACAKEAESWDCHLAAAEIRARGNT